MISIVRFSLIMALTVYVFKEALDMNTASNASELSYSLRSMSELGQVAENIALIVGLIKWNVYFKGKDLPNILACEKTLKRYKYYWTKRNLKKNKECGSTCSIIAILFIVILLLLKLIISIVPTVLILEWTGELFQCKRLNIAIPYAWLAAVSFLANFFARLVMITATIAVGNAWELEDKNQIDDLMKEYKQIGQHVAKIQGIFQAWFVIKWLVYFIDITVDSVIAIRSLFGSDIQNERNTFIYIFMHLIYNFVAFLTLYVCGGLMNSYHDKYCKKVEKKIKSTNFVGTSWEKWCALSYLRKPKYRFIPSLCGLHIPLDSSGYTLSLLLALVAFIANFVSSLTT